MSGFLGIGGSGAQHNRNINLAAAGNLNNVFNYAMPLGENLAGQGQATTAAGVGDINQSLGYWSKLLSGSRPAMQAAIAPETNAVLSGADASKRQQAAMGTARGGGTAGTNQQLDTTTRATIDNALFGVRPEAAKETGELGAKVAGIGQSELAESLNALGLGEDVEKTLSTFGQKSGGGGGSSPASIGSSIAGILGAAFGL